MGRKVLFGPFPYPPPQKPLAGIAVGEHGGSTTRGAQAPEGAERLQEKAAEGRVRLGGPSKQGSKQGNKQGNRKGAS